MNYSELIHFEPIESVVQLKTADSATDAKRLVETFVLSDRMVETLREVVVPMLQFERPADNKGVLIVGNYGTGKSHLMALISAVAEHANLAEALSAPGLHQAARTVAGKFKVFRAEINTTMSLRDFVVGELELQLSNLGVSFRFASAEEERNPKDSLLEMMAAFEAVHPTQGLLLVLDELLDHLRARRDHELILDLNFLRALGEFCQDSRFRFVAGVQETLFDNPRFQFVAETLRRVKDRFEQVRIARQDVAHVVAERLLKKTAQQQALVREHLLKFAPLYGHLNERIEEFVRLFPIHPAYLETFERVYVAEKREILKTISATIRSLVHQEVPADAPGVVAYDAYWPVLRDNPSFRSDPNIREVIEKSAVLESRVEQAFPRKAYKATALRLVHALSVHRLTVGDLYTSIGATAEELRDDLCIILPMPEREAGFLKTLVETVLKDLLRTVSGQFLSYSQENDQYYLDLKKDIDFDSLIEKRAESIEPERLDRAYYDALQRVVLEDPDAKPYREGINLWEYELEWREHKVTRRGYLFFGAPNQRTTAQPPRDFYLYFLQPFEPPPYRDEQRQDEVFFRLAHRDETFERALRLFAAAQELAASASGSNKRTYEEKAGSHLKTLTAWLRDQAKTAFKVIHQGRTKGLHEVVSGRSSANATVQDFVNSAGSFLLAAHFHDLSPNYPAFTVALTGKNRTQAVQEALRWIAGGNKTNQGAAMLDGLGLLHAETLRPSASIYGQEVLNRLASKSHHQVLNRSELIQEDQGVEYWRPFRIEPDLLVLVLGALVHSGDLVLALPARKLDASQLSELARTSVSDLVDFKHLERPRDLPLGALQTLCDLLAVPRGLMVNTASRDEAVLQLQQRIAELVTRLAGLLPRLAELIFWGRPIHSEAESRETRARLTTLKTMFERLQSFNTVGKLKNFELDSATLEAQKPVLAELTQLEGLLSMVQALAAQTSYVGKAEAVLEARHPWQEEVRLAKTQLHARITDPEARRSPELAREIGQALTQLGARFREAYLEAHRRSRLGANDDKKKAKLTRDPRLLALQKLAGLELMPSQQFQQVQNRLLGLTTCYQLTAGELERDPLCAHCSFRPSEEPSDQAEARSALEVLDAQLDRLLSEWTETLLQNLEDPTVRDQVRLVADPVGRDALTTFLTSRKLPDPVEAPFVRALQEVFGGLDKVEVQLSELRSSLLAGGSPCTVVELRDRFSRFVDELVRGKDAKKLRIVLE